MIDENTTLFSVKYRKNEQYHCYCHLKTLYKREEKFEINKSRKKDRILFILTRPLCFLNIKRKYLGHINMDFIQKIYITDRKKTTE